MYCRSRLIRAHHQSSRVVAGETGRACGQPFSRFWITGRQISAARPIIPRTTRLLLPSRLPGAWTNSPENLFSNRRTAFAVREVESSPPTAARDIGKFKNRHIPNSPKLRSNRRAGVFPWSLGKHQNADHDDDGQDGRCHRPAERKATLAKRLVQIVSERRAQWSRQDERGPEQAHTRDACRQIQNCERDECRAEHEGAARIAEAGVRDPVSQRRSQRLRKGDRDPVERLLARTCDRIYVDRSTCTVPNEQRSQHADEKKQRSSGIADTQ